MDEYLKIKSTLLKDFDIRYCIICLKKDSMGLHQLLMEGQN